MIKVITLISLLAHLVMGQADYHYDDYSNYGGKNDTVYEARDLRSSSRSGGSRSSFSSSSRSYSSYSYSYSYTSYGAYYGYGLGLGLYGYSAYGLYGYSAYGLYDGYSLSTYAIPRRNPCNKAYV